MCGSSQNVAPQVRSAKCIGGTVLVALEVDRAALDAEVRDVHVVAARAEVEVRLEPVLLSDALSSSCDALCLFEALF